MRPYTPSDLAQVIALFGASIHSLAAPFYTAEQLVAWAPPDPAVGWWEQRLAARHTFVAESDGVMAGFACYETDGHLDMLYTHPAFARRGVATELCRRVESALLAAGVTRIFTEASLAARPFFDRRGFVVDAEEVVQLRGAHLRRFAMHKEIRIG